MLTEPPGIRTFLRPQIIPLPRPQALLVPESSAANAHQRSQPAPSLPVLIIVVKGGNKARSLSVISFSSTTDEERLARPSGRLIQNLEVTSNLSLLQRR